MTWGSMELGQHGAAWDGMPLGWHGAALHLGGNALAADLDVIPLWRHGADLDGMPLWLTCIVLEHRQSPFV